MIDLSTNLSGIKLKNPIIPASGTFGFGYEFAKYYDINILGSISIKGTTLYGRYGNFLPRIAETPKGLLNSVGLQNPGVKKVIDEELPKLSKVYKKKIIANISGFSKDEYIKCAKLLDKQKIVGLIELNISCPNIHGGGAAFGSSCHDAAEITHAVKKVCKKPVYVKLTPNVTDIVNIAKACEEAGANGLTLINTLLGMRFNIYDGQPILNNKTGGLSGPAILPVALRIIYQVASKTDIPIIGCGGINCANDVIEMISAGASAVEIGSANLINPFACKQIIEDLPKVCNKIGIKSISSIIRRSIDE